MLCRPGLTPVAKLDHAVGDSDGCVDPRVRNAPSSASFLRFGSLPSSIHLRASVGSSPSNPSTKTFSRARLTGDVVPLQKVAETAATRRTTAKRATYGGLLRVTNQSVREGSAATPVWVIFTGRIAPAASNFSSSMQTSR